MKSVIYIFASILFFSCSTVYKTTEFNISSIPVELDYENNDSWAVLPQVWNPSLEEIVGKPKKKNADVFFIYPTLLTDKKDPSWNADVKKASIKKDILQKAVAYQASAWVKAANLYVPYYRQAHYRIFVEPYSSQGKGAGLMACLLYTSDAADE